MFTQIVKDLVAPEPVKRVFSASSRQCTACRALARLVMRYVRAGGRVQPMAKALVNVCYVGFYRSMRVCRGIIHQEKVGMSYYGYLS